MAKVPRELLNEVKWWLSDVGGSPDLVPVDDNNDAWDEWVDWWVDAADEEIAHDVELQTLVNAGEIDVLDAPWEIGPLEDWKPLLKARAAEVRRHVNDYLKWRDSGEVPQY